MTVALASCVLVLVSCGVAAGQMDGSPPLLQTSVQPRVSVKQGTRGYRLHCPASSQANLPLFVEWSKDGETIGAGWLRLRVMPSGDLKLKNVHPEDAGVYECTAANGFGSVHFKYYVRVQERSEMSYSDIDDYDSIETLVSHRDAAPVWKDPDYITKLTSTPVLQQEGSDFQLRCDAEGYPLPDIVWRKDGMTIKEDWSGKWSLQLNKLSDADSGEYECIVRNIFGSKRAMFRLIVGGASIDPPIFHQSHPLNNSVQEGQSATFFCKVRSAIPPQIRWLRRIDFDQQRSPNDTMVEIFGHSFALLEDSTHSVQGYNSTWTNALTLPRARQRHEGWYVCFVTSPTGHMLNRSAYLRVTPAFDTPTTFPLHLVIALPIAALLAIILSSAICMLRRRNTAQNGFSKQQGGQQSTVGNPYKTQPPAPPLLPPPTAPLNPDLQPLYASYKDIYHQEGFSSDYSEFPQAVHYPSIYSSQQ